MIRRPPRSTLFPTRRSSDLADGEPATSTPRDLTWSVKDTGVAVPPWVFTTCLMMWRVAGAGGISLFVKVQVLLSPGSKVDRPRTSQYSSHGHMSYAVVCSLT